MANTGWIKIHRSILDWEWSADGAMSFFFIQVICLCNYEEKQWKGKTIPVGSFITSHGNLSSVTKVSVSSVKRYLKRLEETGEIKVENLGNFGLKICVINFLRYQIDLPDDLPNDLPNDLPVDLQLKKERKKKKRTLPSARPGEDPSFNSAINMTAEQRLDSLSRWSRILNVWKSNEADYILKNAFEKYWMKYSQPLQEEIVQYVESLGPKSVHLSNLWLSTLMKNRLLHPGQIAIEIEKAEKFVKPEKKAPLNHRNNVGKF